MGSVMDAHNERRQEIHRRVISIILEINDAIRSNDMIFNDLTVNQAEAVGQEALKEAIAQGFVEGTEELRFFKETFRQSLFEALAYQNEFVDDWE
jgi:hypothetical protein